MNLNKAWTIHKSPKKCTRKNATNFGALKGRPQSTPTFTRNSHSAIRNVSIFINVVHQIGTQKNPKWNYNPPPKAHVQCGHSPSTKRLFASNCLDKTKRCSATT